MGRYIIRRLLWVVLVVILVTFFAFLIFFVMPPVDPAVLFAGRAPTPRLLEQVKQSFGLDKPFLVQYGLFLKRIFVGDQYGWPGFGFSFLTRSPIRENILGRAFVTFQLAIGAAVIWLFLGVSIGIVSALRRGTFTDRAAMGFALFGVSAPVFWLGLMGLYLFWQKLHWLPGTGYVAFGDSPSQWFLHFILPWVVLAFLFAAFYARMVRGSLLETFGEDWMRTARAKGLSERKVVMKHALRASLTPVVSLFAVDLGTLLGGAIITETVFNLPGLGTYVVRSVNNGDLPVILDIVVFAGLAVAFMSLIADILYAFLDPRVRYFVTPADAAARTVSTEPLLEVRDLKVHFDTADGVVKAVDGVSFSLSRGEALGVVGESGSGKSVSFLSIMGLITRKQARIEGEVIFKGQDLLKLPKEDMRGIRGKEMGMVFQDPMTSLHPMYKVGNQIAEAVRAHQKVSKKAAADLAVEMLRRVGIPKPAERAKQYPHEYSGGMRQRAMIAMALVLNPDLLIADEPTTALDVTVQAQILDLIDRLKDEFDAAVVIITHDLGVVAEHCEAIQVMYAGKIVEKGDPQDIYYHAHHPYTWGLLQSIPRLDLEETERLKPIKGLPPSLINVPPGCSFHPRCPFVMEVCKQEVPPLLPSDGFHASACHLPLAEKERIFAEQVLERA